MTKLQKIQLRRSEIRQRLGDIVNLSDAEMTDEIKAERVALLAEFRDLDTQEQAAIVAEDQDGRLRGGQVVADGATRERLALRGRARLTEYLMAASRGRMVGGAEAELQAAATSEGSGAGAMTGIPLELWDIPREPRMVVTGSPGTVGVNLDPIRPAVFAQSIAMRLGIDMPRVGSGTYASATISGSTTAGSRAKSADAPETAAAFTVQNSSPKRVSARLALTLEDIAAVGTDNFESALRENLALALSAELDDQVINGNGVAPNLAGMFMRLTNPAAPGAAVATFDDFVAAFAAGVDGLWSSMMTEVGIVAGVDTYRLSARTFRDVAGSGDYAFTNWAGANPARVGGWWTNARMPAKVNHVQQAILYRMGRSFMGNQMRGGMGEMGEIGIRTAVCPHWNEIGIDDIYTGSAKAERYFTFHVLLGDVILVQPDAYAEVAFRVSIP